MKNIIISQYRKPYKDNRTRPFIKFKCGQCGNEIEIWSKNYKEDTPCITCQKHNRGKENFFKRAKEKYGDKFDLSKVNYVDSKTKVLIRCVKHNHEYYINPLIFTGKDYSHLQVPHKGGCKYCALESQKESLHKPIEHYINILNERFPQFEVIKHGNADSNTEKITLECPTHGSFETTLARIVSKDTVYLCPNCSREMLSWNTRWHRTDVKGTVYFIYLEELNLYKLGVTHRNIKRRLIEIKHKPKIIWTVDLSTLADAFLLEMYIFRKYQQYKVKDKDIIKFGGYTELLNCYIEKPTEGFIEEILCLKEPNSGELLASKVEDNPERSL